MSMTSTQSSNRKCWTVKTHYAWSVKTNVKVLLSRWRSVPRASTSIKIPTRSNPNLYLSKFNNIYDSSAIILPGLGPVELFSNQEYCLEIVRQLSTALLSVRRSVDKASIMTVVNPLLLFLSISFKLIYG